jgi:hypothetical protein
VEGPPARGIITPVDEHNGDAGQSSDNGGGHGPTNGDLPERCHQLRDFLNRFYERTDAPGAKVDAHELHTALSAWLLSIPPTDDRSHAPPSQSLLYSDLRAHFSLVVRRSTANRIWAFGIVPKAHAAIELSRLVGLAGQPEILATRAVHAASNGGACAAPPSTTSASVVEIVRQATNDALIQVRTDTLDALEKRLRLTFATIDDALASDDIRIRLQATELIWSRLIPKVKVREADPLEQSVAVEPTDRRHLREEIEALIDRTGTDG